MLTREFTILIYLIKDYNIDKTMGLLKKQSKLT